MHLFWQIVLALVAMVLPNIGGFLNGYFVTRPNIDPWFNSLNQPAFNPPNWLFAPAWIVLYSAIGLGSFLVWRSAHAPYTKVTRTAFWWAIAVYGLHIAINWLWTPVFFGWHKLLLVSAGDAQCLQRNTVAHIYLRTMYIESFFLQIINQNCITFKFKPKLYMFEMNLYTKLYEIISFVISCATLYRVVKTQNTRIFEVFWRNKNLNFLHYTCLFVFSFYFQHLFQTSIVRRIKKYDFNCFYISTQMFIFKKNIFYIICMYFYIEKVHSWYATINKYISLLLAGFHRHNYTGRCGTDQYDSLLAHQLDCRRSVRAVSGVVGIRIVPELRRLEVELNLRIDLR